MQTATRTAVSALPESNELEVRLAKIAEPENQGKDFRMERNLTLYLLGLVFPFVLMWAGWYW